MTLPELCVKRPVFATVLSLAILLLGLISYQRLSVREYPRIGDNHHATAFICGALSAVVEGSAKPEQLPGKF
jgi:multidrug efflux pump